MKKFDLIIIGAGLMGCFCARNISKSPINTLVIEKNDDVCREISKANTAVIYSGLDTKPGTLKTALCVRACKDFETLCSELDVPFNRCGSITVSFGEKSHSVLKEKYAKGIKNGVEGLRLLTKKEVLEMEPYLSPKITGGLFSPATGTVNPWELGIAAYENAKYNGIKFSFCENVTDIHRENDGFITTTDKDTYFSKAVLNCAGLYSDKIHDMVEKPVIKIIPDGSDYTVFKKNTPHSPKHIIFQETESGKGITFVPTVEGNLLVGDTKRPFKEDYATDLDGLNEIYSACREVVPTLCMDNVIRSFGAARPNCRSIKDENESISGFKILEENGFFQSYGHKNSGTHLRQRAWKSYGRKNMQLSQM